MYNSIVWVVWPRNLAENLILSKLFKFLTIIMHGDNDVLVLYVECVRIFGHNVHSGLLAVRHRTAHQVGHLRVRGSD